MPLGAARLNFLAKSITVAPVPAEVIRKKVGITALGNAQVDTAQSKFGGSSALFDGTGDYLAMNVPSSYDDDFTIETWVRLDVLPSSNTFRMLFAGNSNLEYASIFADASSNYFSNLVIRNSGGSFYETYYEIPSIAINTWYHWAVVKSGSTIKHFFDGTELTILNSSTGTMASDYGFDGYHYLARWNGNTSHMLDGYMDEVRISNTARYTAGFTPSTTPFTNDDDTLLLLHMDGTDASTYFEDDNGNVGSTNRTALTVTAVADAQIDTAQQYFGVGSALFDGTGDYLKANDTGFDFGTGDFTIECWVRSTSATNQGVFQLSSDSADHLQSSFANLAVAFRGDTSDWTYYSNGANTGLGSASTNTWYHIALVRSSGTINFYVDGTSLNSEADTTDYSGQYLAIGGYYSTSFLLTGNIDEFRVSNIARYSAGFTPSTKPFRSDPSTLLLLHMEGTDGATTFTDDNSADRSAVGVSAIDGAQVDTAQYKFGGTSATFDGTSDSLVTAQTFALGTGDFTIEGWVRTTSLAANQIIVDFREGSSSTAVPLLQIDTSGRLNYYVYPSYRIQSGTSAIAIDTWYHFALVRSSGTSKLYLDGTQVGSDYTDTADYGSRYVRLGRHATLTNGLFGWMDEVRISDSARYTAAFTAPTAPFVNDSNTLLLLHMDGTDGSTLFLDDNGVGRSRVGVSALGNAQVDTADSKFGGASALFDGTGDYLLLPNLTLSGDFTVEFFAKPDATTALQVALRIGHYTGSGWDNEIVFQFRGSTAPSFQSRWYVISDPGSLGLNVASGGGGVWSHIAVTRSGSTKRLFIDGVLIETTTGTGQIGGNTNTDNITIGGIQSGGLTQDFDGWIDEVRISNTARYTAAFTPDTTPFQNDANTLLLLHMDGTDGDTDFVDDNGKEST